MGVRGTAHPAQARDPAPPCQGACRQEDFLHVSSATQLAVPWSSSSCLGLGLSVSLILEATPTRFTVQGRTVQALALQNSRPASIPPACTPPPPHVVKTTSKWKTDEPSAGKVIYIMGYFRASRDERRFITWGRRLMIVESSHTKGADVFYGGRRGGNALV